MSRIVRLLLAGGSEQGGESDAGAGFGRMSRMPTYLEESRRDVQWKLPGEDRTRCKREVKWLHVGKPWVEDEQGSPRLIPHN